MAMVLPMVFISCSDDDNNNPPQEESASIIGTWENEDYFVSFGEDGFYCCYLDEDFIDSGNYKRSDNIITCSNMYFKRSSIN